MTSTSAMRRWPMPLPPAEITSCIEAPRIAPGLCSPSAQSTASVMFDLPEPLGPTITLTPGENSSFARSGKDLNPFISIDLRYICSGPSALEPEGSRLGRTRRLSSAAQTPQRLLGGGLLGRLLAPPLPLADPLGVDDRRHLERAPVRRAGFGGHLVAYVRAAAARASPAGRT